MNSTDTNTDRRFTHKFNGNIKRSRGATVALLCGAVLLGACADMTETQRRTAGGAGIGAVAGAILGGVTGSNNVARDAAIGAGIGGAGTYFWSRRMEEQKRSMEQDSRGTGVQVSQTSGNELRLEIPSDISFAVNRADIQPNFEPILDRFARSLNDHPGTTIRIIGHTDSTGSDAINNPLSVNRAASTRDYLASRGVSTRRMQIDGRGSYEPVADNSTERGRAMNRRVEIYIGEPSPQRQPY